MDLSQSKLFALVSIGVASIFVGLLPACFAKNSRAQWPLLLSSLLCFGGGVLICTSLVHILPEAREATKNDYKNYIELIFCIGFFILYLMDEIVHYFYGEVAGHSHNLRNNNNNYSSTSAEIMPGPSATSFYGSTHHHNQLNESKSLLETIRNNDRHHQLPYNPNFFNTRTKSESALFCDEPPSQLCHGMHVELCQTTIPTMNVGLLAALSIHSILEGLIVGLEDESSSKVLLLLGAIASHKLVVGFCLGMELASNEFITFCKHFICILVFAAASVLGIFFGIIISHISNSDVMGIIIPMLQALAGGTLLYVTVSEILPRERARWHNNNHNNYYKQHLRKSAGIFQFLAVIAGFTLMGLLGKYLGQIYSTRHLRGYLIYEEEMAIVVILLTSR